MSEMYQMAEATAALDASPRRVQGLVRRMELKHAPGRGHFHHFSRADLLALMAFDYLLRAGLNADAARVVVDKHIRAGFPRSRSGIVRLPVAELAGTGLAVEVALDPQRLDAMLDQRLRRVAQQVVPKRGRPRRDAVAEFVAVGRELGQALADVPAEVLAAAEAKESAATRRGVKNRLAKRKLRG